MLIELMLRVGKLRALQVLSTLAFAILLNSAVSAKTTDKYAAIPVPDMRSNQPSSPLPPPCCECVDYARYYYCLSALSGDYLTANSLVEPERTGGLWMSRQDFSQDVEPTGW